MTVRNLLSTMIGAVMVALGFAWSIFDATQHQGRVGMSTLVLSLALTAAGGFLISKTRTKELFVFLFTLGRDARAVVKDLPSDGSGDAR